MTWEYRVVRFLNAVPGGKIIDWLQIHRVYYRGDTISAWEPEQSKVSGESPNELMACFILMRLALRKPVLKVEDMPK